MDAYSYYLKMERRLSPNTVAAYSSDVSDFLKGGFDPRLCTSEDVIDYISARAEHLSKRSQARLLSSLRSYFDFLVREGEREDNPCDNIDAPKLGRYLPEVLSAAEIDAIMESVDLSSWQGVRDRAILEMLYGSGLRVSELCSLRLSDIYADQSFLRIIGKGNKERIVPMGDVSRETFSEWLALRPEPASADFADMAFLNRFGRSLSRVSVFNMVKRQALIAGVRKTISPHSFRHSFATHLIENGADLRVVQEMLGHESILTTEIYTHIDSRTWQAAILEHHPRRK